MKRTAPKQIARDSRDAEEELDTTPRIADADTMAARRTVRIKRGMVPSNELQSAETPQPTFAPNPFAAQSISSIAPLAPQSAPKLSTGGLASFVTIAPAAPSVDASILAPPNSEPNKGGPPLSAPKDGASQENFSPISDNNVTGPSGSTSATLDFTATPANKLPFTFGGAKFGGTFGANVSSFGDAMRKLEEEPYVAPVTDAKDIGAGDDVNNLRDAETRVATNGEEHGNVIYEGAYKLYELVEKAWHERGMGDLRILTRSEDSRKKKRIVMRNSGTKNILLNANVDDSFKVVKAEEKSLLFACISGSQEDAVKSFLVRPFKNADPSSVKKLSDALVAEAIE